MATLAELERVHDTATDIISHLSIPLFMWHLGDLEAEKRAARNMVFDLVRSANELADALPAVELALARANGKIVKHLCWVVNSHHELALKLAEVKVLEIAVWALDEKKLSVFEASKGRFNPEKLAEAAKFEFRRFLRPK